MKTLLNSRFFYFLLPVYFSLALILVFFNVPDGFFPSLISLLVVVTPIVVISKLIYPLNLEIGKSYNFVVTRRGHRKAIIFFSLVVLVSGPFDILINGFKLFNPLSYAEFNGIGRYIRHISISCWILIPVSFIFIKNSKIKFILIIYALIFPIFIVDRNRLLMSFYTLILCIAFTPQSFTDKLKSRRRNLTHFFALPLVFIFVFSILGLYRSGNAFLVESSGELLEFGALPLRENFYYLPELLQQVVLYVTTPLFNFSTVVFSDYLSDIFLLSQLSPFGRDQYDAYPYAPVMVERYNVGTEFYPWLLYGGLPAVIFSFIFMLFSFFCSVHLLRKRPNIFTLIIFLRISYTILFMGFAPQFYILLNLSFILLIIGLWFGSGALQSALCYFTQEKEKEKEKEKVSFAEA